MATDAEPDRRRSSRETSLVYWYLIHDEIVRDLVLTLVDSVGRDVEQVTPLLETFVRRTGEGVVQFGAGSLPDSHRSLVSEVFSEAMRSRVDWPLLAQLLILRAEGTEH